MNKIIICMIFAYVANYAFADELPPEMREMIKNLHDACVAETGVSEALIDGANKGDFKTDTPLKCYMKCLMSTIGILDDEGVVDTEAYVDLLPDSMKEHGQQVADKCKPAGKGDPCEVAYQLNVCSYGVNPAKYRLF